jgi:hypothetical protein
VIVNLERQDVNRPILPLLSAGSLVLGTVLMLPSARASAPTRLLRFVRNSVGWHQDEIRSAAD